MADVEVEEWLAGLVPTFLATRRDEVARLAEALEAGDLEAARAVGHKLRGAASSYGFDELAGRGALLEQAATLGEARLCAAEIVSYLARLRVSYR